MPRGQHPNSRKALEESRKKGQFSPGRGGNAVKNAIKGNEVKKAQRDLRATLKDKIYNGELKDKLTDVIIEKSLEGNQYFVKILLEMIGEDKAKQSSVENGKDDQLLEVLKESLRGTNDE